MQYPKYAPVVPEWENISGMKRSKTYEFLGDGKLRAIKVGKRLLIDVEHGLAYLATLPVAQIRQSPRSAAAKINAAQKADAQRSADALPTSEIDNARKPAKRTRGSPAPRAPA